MTMKDFAEIIKQSHIIGDNQTVIIFELLQALGAKKAIKQTASNRASERSPSQSTIKKWLSGKEKPGTIRYFPNLKVENEKGAYDFLCRALQKNQWKELQGIFKEWYNNRKTPDKEFYINIETNDFDTFLISFWRQFVSFFPSLRMWDAVKEQYPEKEINQRNSKNKIANEMMDVFRECFVRYRVFEFIPKEI